MLPSRLRALLTGPVPTSPGTTRVAPAWLLLPGLALLAGSLLAWAMYMDGRWYLAAMDLQVYTGGAKAFLQGKNPYELGFTWINAPYTYPPISLLLFAPLTFMSHAHAVQVFTTASVIMFAAVLWLGLSQLGYTGRQGKAGIVAAVTAVMIWTEPLSNTLDFGQINVILMALVVMDLALPDRRKGKGALIGVAAAVKLIPAIFVLYLLLTRRFRAAFTAMGTFVALFAVGWIAAPKAAGAYWLGGLFFDSSRVSQGIGIRYNANQSLHGLATRVLGERNLAEVLWLAAAVMVLVLGMALAMWAHRLGEEFTAVVIVAVVAMLISPIAWSHHWVWIAPIMLIMGHAVVTLRGRIQNVVAVFPVLLVMAYATWPIRSERVHAGEVEYAWAARGMFLNIPEFHRDVGRYESLLGFLQGDLFSLAGLAIVAAAAAWLWHLERERAAAPVTGGAPARFPADDTPTLATAVPV